MKALQICHKPPFPQVDGGTIAMASFFYLLNKAGISVDIFTLSTHKHPFNPNEFPTFSNVINHFVNTKSSASKALINLMAGKSYNISRFSNKTAENSLKKLLLNKIYDFVIFESIYSLPYLEIVKKYSNAKTILRSHNVEYALWEQKTLHELNPIKKSYFSILTNQLRKFEFDNVKKVDGIIFISNNDKRDYESELGPLKNIVIPTCFELPSLASDQNPKVRVGFIGSLDWEPNTKTIDYILSKIKSKNNLPFEFHFAGRNGNQYKSLDIPNVIFHGEVKSAEHFIKSLDVFVNPVFSGSGLKIKNVQALASGIPLITTTIGIEGIPAFANRHYILYEMGDDLITKIQEIIENPTQRINLSKNGRLLFEEFFSFEPNRKKLNQFLNSVNES